MTDPPEEATTPRPLPANPLAGRFRYGLDTGRWWWSNEFYLVHGFEPHEVVPTTDLVLAHARPADRDALRQSLEDAKVTGTGFSTLYRMVDALGRDHAIALVGEAGHDPDRPRHRELVGFFIDVTPATDRPAAEVAPEALATLSARASLEQAKGIIAFVIGTDIDDAASWMRLAAERLGVELVDLAHTIVDQAASPGRDPMTVLSTYGGPGDQKPQPR